MSYEVCAFAVSIGGLSAALGSGDRGLLDALVARPGASSESIDAMARDFAEGSDLGPAPSVADALRHLVLGEPRDQDFGFVYGYAFVGLCDHLGEALPANGWSAIRSDWIEAADEALKAAGVPAEVLSVARLIGRDAPVALPRIDDFPSIGYLRIAEVRAALAEFGESELAACEDEDLASALAELLGWLRRCDATGRDLVCAYS